MNAVAEQISLFKLDWLRNPEAALEQGRAQGISDPHFVEMSAWCAELHAQLAALAEERDVPLLLMGGNAAALRLEASKQRGSRDNDYLTTANEHDVRALMDALVSRFSGVFEEPLFRYRELTGGPNAEPLPMVAFSVDVPALLDANAKNGMLGIKLEFHIEDAGLFPAGESVSGRFFALAEDIRALIPKLPYQIALKLMTLHAPPVGINLGREDSIPRQMYDLDSLLGGLDDADQWAVLATYTQRRYIKEEEQRDREPDPRGPWASMAHRLGEWAAADDPEQRYAKLIGSFQGSQVSAGTKQSPALWRGRARRLQFAVRALALGEDGYPRWQRALSIESRIAEPAGTRLKEYRQALSEVTGIPAKKLGQYPRVPFWSTWRLPTTSTLRSKRSRPRSKAPAADCSSLRRAAMHQECSAGPQGSGLQSR